MSEKTYINNISVKENQYSINVSMNFAKFIEEVKEHVNEKGYLNLTLGKRKIAGKYGETHYCAINDWKPSGEVNRGVKNENKSVEVDEDLDSSLPF